MVRNHTTTSQMRDPDHAMTLIEAVTGAVKIPVTLKMRLGWDHDSINAPQLAARAQSAGISMITVHARTRCQFYRGVADWQAVRKVCEATCLPLVVNGDITDTDSVRKALLQSRGDAVMLGRACYGAPWLPGSLTQKREMSREKKEKILQIYGSLPFEHFEGMRLHYGTENGIRKFRKHLAWYLDSMAGRTTCIKLRKAILTSSEPAVIRKMMMQAFYRR